MSFQPSKEKAILRWGTGATLSGIASPRVRAGRPELTDGKPLPAARTGAGAVPALRQMGNATRTPIIGVGSSHPTSKPKESVRVSTPNPNAA